LNTFGVDSTRVTFVAADFETDDWLARLVEAGFDPGKPAFFLWEGVMMYLERQAVEATLRKIAGTVSCRLGSPCSMSVQCRPVIGR